MLYVSSFSLCFLNSSPFQLSKLSQQFKPLNSIPLSGRKQHCNIVRFPRERIRTRATIDDVETDQLSSTPIVENEKAIKVPSYPLGFPLMFQALFFRFLDTVGKSSDSH